MTEKPKLNKPNVIIKGDEVSVEKTIGQLAKDHTKMMCKSASSTMSKREIIYPDRTKTKHIRTDVFKTPKGKVLCTKTYCMGVSKIQDRKEVFILDRGMEK